VQKENKQEFEDQRGVCKYHLQRDSANITMIAECKECQGEANLTDSTCRSGILKGLYNEYNVNSVILSHYIETKYTRDSMQMLRMMVEILQDFEQLSIREPFNESFNGNDPLTSQSKNQQKMECEKCHLKPEKIFSKLKEDFLTNITGFYKSLKTISKEVADNTDNECQLCINATESDLMYLFSKLENLRSFAIYKGYQIVI
jgi:hypothetical protein